MPAILSKIEISNFKSFRSEKIIRRLGPDEWIAVIGQNGSGIFKNIIFIVFLVRN